MFAKGFHHGGSTWRDIPRNSSSVFSNIPPKRCFDELSNQIGFSSDWRYHPEMVYNRNWIRRKIFEIIQNEQLGPALEILLLTNAASKEEYMNLETLNQRVQALLGVPKSYNTGYYGVQEAGISHPSIAHNLPCFPGDGSSIPPVADMDVLSNLPVSYGGSNLDANTRSTSNYFSQQHANNLEMDLTKYKDCFPTTMGRSLQSEDLSFMFFQSASVNTSEDTMQYQPHKLDFQKNSTVRHVVNDVPSDNTESILRPAKIQKMMDSGFGVSSTNHPSFDQWNNGMVQPYSFQPHPEVQQHSEFPLSSLHYESNVEQITNPIFHSAGVKGINNNVMVDTFGQPGLESYDVMDSNNLKNLVTGIKSRMQYLDMDPIPTNGEDIQGRTEFDHGIRLNSSMPTLTKEPIPTAFWTNATKKADELTVDQEKLTKSSVTTVSGKTNYVIYDLTSEPKMIPSKGLEAGRISYEPDSLFYGMIDCRNSVEVDRVPELITIDGDDDEEDIQGRIGFNHEGTDAKEKVSEPKVDQEKKDLESHVVIDSCKSIEIDIGSNSNIPALISKVATPIDVDDKQNKIGFNQEGTNAKEKVSEPTTDQEKQTKFSNTIVDAVSLIDLFTRDQITEHINSLRKESVLITSEEEAGTEANTCQLCERKKLYFAPVPIVCSCCGIRVKRIYFCRKEELDVQGCICSMCYKTSKGGKITFNGTSISKKNLKKRTNDEVLEEPWVECNKCKRWQHQICALYNSRRDLDCRAEYICPVCRSKEIENGKHAHLLKAANFGAKDLPRTVLSDHLEKRLIECLIQERAKWENVEGNENLDKAIAAKGLSIREVLSVDKQLKVNKQFLDIIPEENYPAEFSYRSRVILLFQQIEGADICIFGMYVQEFGSECGNPNQRCVYISYLDSVKYFMPERRTKSGEALRTFVYHEILIGYLDFCKKRGFLTCYIWACAPSRKGDDYILYCHPKEQKTPKNDKLRRWYLSMLKKATEENIVVGLTNVYDHFFVAAEKGDSKVTASRLPYFDGDFWSGNAMEAAKTIEKECGGDYEKMLKEQVPNRALKTMGHANPSKDTAKDILVMRKVGQNIWPTRESFLIAHLQYACIHCREVIVSGKRWFCTECKEIQECERCHSSDQHPSKNGELHTLCQAVVDDIPSNTKHNDIVLESRLFENRDNFLSFCQKSQFQFDTLRHAKYSSMMVLYHLHNPTLMTVVKCCSICTARNVFQKSWKCEICPECTICSACYKDRGADCHEHKLTQNEHKLTQNELKLTQNYSRPIYQSGNQESNEKMMVKLLNVLKHASQCRAANAEPCSHPNCSQIKKLFSHASRCKIRVNRGCQQCKKIWFILAAHSRNCKDSECSIPRCRDLKKHLESKAMHSESWRGTAVFESDKAVVDQ